MSEPQTLSQQSLNESSSNQFSQINYTISPEKNPNYEMLCSLLFPSAILEVEAFLPSQQNTQNRSNLQGGKISQHPKNVTPAIGVPKNVTPAIGVPKNVTPAIGVPKNVTPAIGVPKNVTPATSVPKNVTDPGKVAGPGKAGGAGKTGGPGKVAGTSSSSKVATVNPSNPNQGGRATPNPSPAAGAPSNPSPAAGAPQSNVEQPPPEERVLDLTKSEGKVQFQENRTENAGSSPECPSYYVVFFSDDDKNFEFKFPWVASTDSEHFYIKKGADSEDEKNICECQIKHQVFRPTIKGDTRFDAKLTITLDPTLFPDPFFSPKPPETNNNEGASSETTSTQGN